MSRLVITGATGFLGGALIDELERHGELEGAIALCRRPVPALSARGVEVRVGDLDDAQFLAESLSAGCRVIHLAGAVEFHKPDARALMQIHVEATRALASAALKAGVKRFVLMSSSGTSAVSRRPVTHDESAPVPMDLIGRWPYYVSKALQERLVLDLVRTAGLPAVVLNPSLLLGPGDARGGSTAVVSDFLAGRMPLTPSGGISVVDVRDVAATTRAALALGRVGERYMLGSYNGTFGEFFERLARVSGVAAPAIGVPNREIGVFGARLMEKLVRKRDPALAEAFGPEKVEMAAHYWYVDWSKAASELGFRPRPLGVTLADTVADSRARGALVKGEKAR